MTAAEQFAEIREMLKPLAVTVVAHDNQIEALIKIGEQQGRDIQQLKEAIAATERQWQAYINTLPRQ